MRSSKLLVKAQPRDHANHVLRPAEEQIEVAEFQSHALSGLPDELVAASEILRVGAGVGR